MCPVCDIMVGEYDPTCMTCAAMFERPCQNSVEAARTKMRLRRSELLTEAHMVNAPRV